MSDWQSQPLSGLLKEIGEAIACLNTTVVGLDAVEKGHEKPANLDISWSPGDRIAASRKARKFIVESVLVRAFEALYQHSLLLIRLPRFSNLVRNWNNETTKADKIWDIYSAILGRTYLVASAALIAHWRNRIIHPGSKAKLKHEQKLVLHKNESEIENKYKNLNVDCLLCHFEEGRPTLKDVSSLVAMIINLAREVDEVISSTLNKDDFDTWLDYLNLSKDIDRIKAETKPEKRAASIRRLFSTKAPRLLIGYEKYHLDSYSD